MAHRSSRRRPLVRLAWASSFDTVSCGHALFLAFIQLQHRLSDDIKKPARSGLFFKRECLFLLALGLALVFFLLAVDLLVVHLAAAVAAGKGGGADEGEGGDQGRDQSFHDSLSVRWSPG